MLIRFSVENFLSFAEKEVFTMAAGNERIHNDHLEKVPNADISVQRLAALYGANASGKSNFVKAIFFLKKIICEGRKVNQSLGRKIFRLNTSFLSRDTVFEIDFSVDNKVYFLEVGFDNHKVTFENLCEIRKGVEKKLYCRSLNEIVFFHENIKKDMTKKEKQNLEFVAKGTRENQLFLWESIDRNLDYFRTAFLWFSDHLFIVFPDSKYIPLELQIVSNKGIASFVSRFLKSCDTGIERIEGKVESVKEVIRNKDELEKLSDILNEENAVLVSSPHDRLFILEKDEHGDMQAIILKTIKKVGGEEFEFDLKEESDGTRRLLDLMPVFLQLEDQGDKVFIIDEIDRSLHPILLNKVVQDYLNLSKGKPSQLIFTTHQIHIMSLDLFRRGELWFVDKRMDGSSQLRSLLDFDKKFTRRDKVILNLYKSGRLGGTPVIPNLTPLATFEEEKVGSI